MTPSNYHSLDQILMMPDEIEKMVGLIKSMPEQGLMVEWGSGGSTCKWLESFEKNQRLITIEHHKDWYEKVNRSINEHFGNIENKFKFIFSPEKYGYDHGYGGIEEENPFGMDHYVNPDPEIFEADLYLIDGIARGACLMSILLNSRKKDPIILIHDYVPRVPAYIWASQFCDVEIIGTTLAKLRKK